MYSGLIYNDCFSKPFNIFGSYWLNTYTHEEMAELELIDINPSNKTRKTYPFGLDPAWAVSYIKALFRYTILNFHVALYSSTRCSKRFTLL